MHISINSPLLTMTLQDEWDQYQVSVTILILSLDAIKLQTIPEEYSTDRHVVSYRKV
jgi:hypothetical protein